MLTIDNVDSKDIENMLLLLSFLQSSFETKQEYHPRKSEDLKCSSCKLVTLDKSFSSQCFSFLIHYVKEYCQHSILPLLSVKIFYLKLTEPNLPFLYQKGPIIQAVCRDQDGAGLRRNQTQSHMLSPFLLLCICSLPQTRFSMRLVESQQLEALRSSLHSCCQNKGKVLSEWQFFLIICPVFPPYPYSCLMNILLIIAQFSHFPHFILNLAL